MLIDTTSEIIFGAAFTEVHSTFAYKLYPHTYILIKPNYNKQHAKQILIIIFQLYSSKKLFMSRSSNNNKYLFFIKTKHKQIEKKNFFTTNQQIKSK